MDDRTGREAVEAVWRIESARIVGALARYTGDFALAEDLAQEALAEALVAWPRDGVPRNPAGWLLTVGRRRAIDTFRRRRRSTSGTPLARDLARDARRAGRPGGGRRAVGPGPDRRRRARADVRRVPPGALARGPGGADPAGGRRPDQRRDRPRVPGADRDRPGPDHPREEDDRGGAGAVRGAADRGAPRSARLGAQRPLRDLHGGVDGDVRGPTGSAPTSPTRRCGWPGCWPSWCPTSRRCTACWRCSS